jgi:hypothetical protein
VIHEHGWDEDRDRADTQAALLDPAPAPDQPGSRQFYFFHLGPNKIVRPTEPAKRGIITSFAYPGWFRQSDFPGL